MVLNDLQTVVRRAMTSGECDAELLSLIACGEGRHHRFTIHQRHYEASLVSALLSTFPATIWLMGSTFVTEAARRFVRVHPPDRPCIAEYGASFPAFLAEHDSARRVPYLAQFSELEWRVGRVALSVDSDALPVEELSSLGADTLASTAFATQPGVQYLRTEWPVDDLLKVYLTDSETERFELRPMDVQLEVRGARGEFRIVRLAAGDFAFRERLQAGSTIGDAAEAALDADTTFDPGAALIAVFADGLVTAVRQKGEAA